MMPCWAWPGLQLAVTGHNMEIFAQEFTLFPWGSVWALVCIIYCTSHTSVLLLEWRAFYWTHASLSRQTLVQKINQQYLYLPIPMTRVDHKTEWEQISPDEDCPLSRAIHVQRKAQHSSVTQPPLTSVTRLLRLLAPTTQFNALILVTLPLVTLYPAPARCHTSVVV